ncbi:MAG: tail fiber protein [Candidatus Marinimicrobia bacterium]|nr:tail fiber protein [Candidatus Neomarinimicrobiota bacterium]
MISNTIKPLLIIILLASTVFAQTFSVQGVLRDPQGNTLDEGHYDITLKLYEQAEGTDAIWEEVQTDIHVLHGVFDLDVGSVTPLTGISFTATYYLGLTIEYDPEMVPRFELLKAPSALSVGGAENMVPSLGNIGIGTTDPQAGLHIVTYESDDNLIKVESESGKGIKVDSFGDLYLEGGAVIKFADGTELSSSILDEPATALKSNGDVTFRTDADMDGNGRLEFIIHDSLQLKISEDDGVSTSGVTIGGSYPGTMVMFAGITPPDGWLLCDGTEYNTAEYPMLYNMIGATYGSGAGTFMVPDMRGKGDMGYDAANVKFDALGETGGEETHTLTVDEMPEHSHYSPAQGESTNYLGEHNHTDDNPQNDYYFFHVWGEQAEFSSGEAPFSYIEDNMVNSDDSWANHTYTSTAPNHSHTLSFPTQTTDSKGGDTGYNIMHSYLTMNYIIKY